MNQVECGRHGIACAAYVCQHLVEADGMGWCSAPPSDEDPWPNAWCEACHDAFAAEDEWNERSEAAAGLRVTLVCHHCYEQFKARCHPRIV